MSSLMIMDKVIYWFGEDPITHKEGLWCCGTYNDYQNDLEDIANYVNERRKKLNG